MFDSILVVCIGNICRSPIGERLFRQAFPNKTVASAGLAALVGNPADPMSVEVSAEHGLSLDGHRAQQLTKIMCLQYDLILVMEEKHIEGVCRLAPEVRGKVMLFGHWLKGLQVPDPYRKEKADFEQAYSLLAQSMQPWIDKLSK